MSLPLLEASLWCTPIGVACCRALSFSGFRCCAWFCWVVVTVAVLVIARFVAVIRMVVCLFSILLPLFTSVHRHAVNLPASFLLKNTADMRRKL